MSPKRICIVGGVAGGASAAVRARRLDEDAEITLIERGPDVSFANCGMPYHLGGEIEDREHLVVQSPADLAERFRIQVRTGTEVRSIDREGQKLHLLDLASGQEEDLGYDALILSTGASPLTPPIPGIERPGHFVLRNLQDMDAIDAWIDSGKVEHAVVIGGGFVGIEMAEQLRHRKLAVSLVEAAPQVMRPFDPELAARLHQSLRDNQVELYLGDGVKEFQDPGEGSQASQVVLQSGAKIPADLVILSLGVRPATKLAQEAGLELGPSRGIRVGADLRTSDPKIFAVGDVIEVEDPVTGTVRPVPLAGPANRQGRIAAANALGGDEVYSGTLGTAILRVFGLVAGCTGANRESLTRAEIPFHEVHVHRGSHAGYYPGSETVSLKVLFAPETGKLLGAQVLGRDGVDKRIDVLATALKAGLTVEEVAELELAYAPPFGSAKDPVNIVGMAATNLLDGSLKLVPPQEVLETTLADRPLVVDVRSAKEIERDPFPGAKHIPVDDLREHLDELRQEPEVWTLCRSGQRSYLAHRILAQEGIPSRSLDGGMLTLGPFLKDSNSEGSRP